MTIPFTGAAVARNNRRTAAAVVATIKDAFVLVASARIVGPAGKALSHERTAAFAQSVAERKEAGQRITGPAGRPPACPTYWINLLVHTLEKALGVSVESASRAF